MTLIEGVGDEVIQFLVALLLVWIALLAWWSTNARPVRYRTVLVMRSRTHPVTVSFRRNNLMISNTQTDALVQASPSEAAEVNTESVEEAPRENARVIPMREMDSIVDADMAMMNNNRLHFYRRIDSSNNTETTNEASSEESESQEEPELASNAQIREMDSIVNAMEADVTAGCDFFRSNESTSSLQSGDAKNTDQKDITSTANVNKPEDLNADNDNNDQISEIDGDRRKILIKLKYLNDTLKEVEGSLDELLKDFKWRHFSTELSEECRVRLIFNGRVLDEADTLRACGLHHRAVVHCLVHPRRTQAREEPVVTAGAALGPGAPGAEAERPADRPWDLENILMTLVSVALTIVWFFRCEYSNMFTASASVALFGLTVFYSVAVFGLYLSDVFQLDRRAAPVRF